MSRLKIVLFALPLLFIACVTEEEVIVQSDEVVEFKLPESRVKEAVVEQKTITGSFQSVEGVMDRLSCFCSFGGYITTETGKKMAVCFDESVESCPKITVTGYQTSKQINGSEACSAGIMGYLKVQSYIIGETDF